MVEQLKLKTIWSIYNVIQLIFGYRLFKSANATRIQQALATFLMSTGFFLDVTCWWSFFFTTGDISLTVYYANAGNCCNVGNLFLAVFVNLKTEYEALLWWCEKTQQKFGDLHIFKRCKRLATNLYIFMAVFVPILSAVLFTVQLTILSLKSGKIVPPFLTKIPSESSVVLMSLSLSQIAGVFIIMVYCGAVMGLIFVLLAYFIAGFEYLADIAKTLSPDLEIAEFQRIVRDFVVMHNEIMDTQ